MIEEEEEEQQEEEEEEEKHAIQEDQLTNSGKVTLLNFMTIYVR